MVYDGKKCAGSLLNLVFICFQVGTSCGWIRDSKNFILEKFDVILNFPCHIYNSALQFCPHSSWLYQCYIARFPPKTRVVVGQTEWRYNRTVPCECLALAHKNNIVAAGNAHEILILDATTGSQAAVFSGHLGYVTCLTFSMEGALLVSGSEDCTVKIWDVQTGGVIKSFDCTSKVASVSISADNTMIAIGSIDNAICLLNIETWGCHRIQGTANGGKPVVCFSPNNPQLLLSVFENNNTMWWWGINGYYIGPLIISNYIAFASDGTQFVSCHGEYVIVQNTDSGEVVAEFHKPGANFNYCCFSPDNKFIACSTKGIVYFLDTTGSKPLQLAGSLDGHTEWITSIVLSSSCTLISADHTAIKLWEISDSLSDPVTLVTEPIQPAPVPITAVSMQSKDGLAFSIDEQGIVKSWNILTGCHIKTFRTQAKGIQQGDMQSISNRLIIVGDTAPNSGEICIWDVEEQKSLAVDTKGSFIYDIRIAGDGSKFFTISTSAVEDGSSVQAWSLGTGDCMGKVVLEGGFGLPFDPLCLDGSKVAVLGSCPQVCDFGAQGTVPVKSPEMASDRLYPELIAKPHAYECKFQVRIEDKSTKKVFPLPDRYTYAQVLQWDGQYVIAGYDSGEVLILNLNNMSS